MSEYIGHIDQYRNGAVLGWAYDSHAPNDRVTISVFLGETEIATARADQFRSDLGQRSHRR